MENITNAERNKMAATYGLLLGLIYVILTTGVNMAVGSLFGFYGLKFVVFVLYFVMLGVFAARIRTANGGFITFKEVFGAVIIIIFIAALINYLYTAIYIKYIDPAFMDKMKNTTIQYMEKNKVDEARIDESVRKFDEGIVASKKFDLGKNVLAYFELVIFDCLIGLIVCAIVKKNRPVFE